MALADEVCLVVGVIDGDTVDVRCGVTGAYKQRRIRLAEVDAPERGQPYGQRSRQALAAVCFGRLAIVRVRGSGGWRRAAAHLECAGQDVGTELVRGGWAWAEPRYVRDPELLHLEASARAQRAGLWVDPAPVPPWEWRRRKARTAGR